MTFQECYDQVILPTYERLKKKYESDRSLGCEGLIEIQGASHFLSMQNPNEKGGWYWAIAFTPDEGSEGTLTGWHMASSDAEMFLQYKVFWHSEIAKLKPPMIESEANRLMHRIAQVFADHKRRWPDSYKDDKKL